MTTPKLQHQHAGAMRRYAERTTRVVRQLSSPVFISTSPEGRRTLGLGHIPAGRPLVLVGERALCPGAGALQYLQYSATVPTVLATALLLQ